MARFLLEEKRKPSRQSRLREAPARAVLPVAKVVLELERVVQALAKEALELEKVVQELERELARELELGRELGQLEQRPGEFLSHR